MSRRKTFPIVLCFVVLTWGLLGGSAFALDPLIGCFFCNMGPPPPKPPPEKKRSNLFEVTPSNVPGSPGGLSIHSSEVGGFRSRGGPFARLSEDTLDSAGTWEQWWALNRYRFLRIQNTPFCYEASSFPVTVPGLMGKTRPKSLKTRCIELLRPFLDDPSARVRGCALVSLGKLNDIESLPKIIEMLQDPNRTVQFSALLALGFIQCSKAQYTLLHLAEGTDRAANLLGQQNGTFDTCAFAGLLLAMRQARCVMPLLLETARNAECRDEERALALESLGLIGGEVAARFLTDFTLERRPNSRLLSVAVTALGKTNEAVALPHLLQCLASEYMAVRQSAALALGRCTPRQDEKTVKRFWRCFGSSRNQTLRGFSLLSIGRIGGTLAMKHLKTIVKRSRMSPDLPWACLGLGIALSFSDDKEGADLLISKLTKSYNRSTRKAAAIALGVAGCDEAVKDLIRAVESENDPQLRGYCAEALGMIGNPLALPTIRRALVKESVSEVHHQAALALCLMKDRDSLFRLTDMLNTTKSEKTAAMVSRSLVYLGTEQTAEKLLEFLAEGSMNEMNRLYAMILISKLVSGQKLPYLHAVAECSNYNSAFPITRYLLEIDV